MRLSVVQHLAVIVTVGTTAAAFSTTCPNRVLTRDIITTTTTSSRLAESSNDNDSSSSTVDRANFLSSSALAITSATLLTLQSPQPALARGRATLDQSYDRYTPRIIAGGEYFKTDLRKIIERDDWSSLKAATSDPPKKSKADRSKIDGGVADRAKQAGGFSDARVLVAADLFAASFSDSSVTSKTKSMKENVEKLRVVVEGMNDAAKQALGEEKGGGGGGLFGIGGSKPPSQAELRNTVRKLYVEGGNYWNQYIFAANDGLPIAFQKLPYL